MIRTRTLIVVSTLALALPIALAARAPAFQDKGGTPEKPEQHEEHESPLGSQMQILQAGLKGLGKALEKKDLPRVLALVTDMQKAAHEAKLLAPPDADAIQDLKEKGQLLHGFRLQIIELEKALLDVEVAALNGKADEVKKLLDNKVVPIKKAGHDTYKKD